MVIDVDHELLLKTEQPRSGHVGTFDNENAVIRLIRGGRYSDIVCARQLLIGVRHRVAHDHFYVFIKSAQQPVKTERGAKTVAVRTKVRRDGKSSLVFN